MAKNRCWTADRLRRRGLQHPPRCPLCDQEQETIEHLIIGCVVSRAIWHEVLDEWHMQSWMPIPDMDLIDWWTMQRTPSSQRRDSWSVVILVMWCIWTHRNDVVFNGASVSASGTVRKIREEIELWRRAMILRSELFRTAALEPARWHEGE